MTERGRVGRVRCQRIDTVWVGKGTVLGSDTTLCMRQVRIRGRSVERSMGSEHMMALDRAGGAVGGLLRR
jgi:hypothetical protein